MSLITRVERVYAGGLTLLHPEGQSTGMYKRRLTDTARIERHGIVGDQHADTRVHGGPEKAVHHYAAENYFRLAEAFPNCAEELIPGSLGENITTYELTEKSVFLGDLYRIGTAILQVSQPRTPCWKINHRFHTEHLSMFIANEGLTGWYYRVLQPGSFQEGDLIQLLERTNQRFSIEEFWKVQLQHRPNIQDLYALQAVHGLSTDWKKRLLDRAKWLEKLS